jgi:hypothetical protein
MKSGIIPFDSIHKLSLFFDLKNFAPIVILIPHVDMMLPFMFSQKALRPTSSCVYLLQAFECEWKQKPSVYHVFSKQALKIRALKIKIVRSGSENLER